MKESNNNTVSDNISGELKYDASGLAGKRRYFTATIEEIAVAESIRKNSDRLKKWAAPGKMPECL